MNELALALKSSKSSSASGLDRLDNRILKCILASLLSPLLDIFNRILVEGEFPSSWKSSLVIFIPKSNSVGFRPISLLSCLMKLMERCIYIRLR